MLVYEDKTGEEISLTKRTKLDCIPHLHHHIEAGYIIKGSTKVVVDNIEYTANAGEAFLIFPNRIHSYVGSDDVEDYLLIAPPEAFTEFSEVFSRCELSNPIIKPSDGKALETAFSSAVRFAEIDETTPFSKEAAHSYAAVVVAQMLYSVGTVRHSQAGELDAVQKILLYCDTNYKDDLSLDTLSVKLGYSKFYISHIFATNVKMSFSQYLRYLRIAAAKRQLRHTDMTITDVAYDVGYLSIRTFNRQFLQETGMTPSEYVKKHRV